MNLRRSHSLALLTAGLALLLVFAVGVDAQLDEEVATSTAAPAAPEPILAGSGLDGLDGSIEDAQQRLEELPGDWTTWARLGATYVEQARITGDPSYYARSEGALERSLQVRPQDNDLAHTGLGALANARHDFALAAREAERALEVNPASATAYGVLADARIQLGEYDAATQAVQQMLDLRPGLPSLTRASYDLELRGRVAEATSVMERALEMTDSRAGIAWVRAHLAQLAFGSGDLETAREHLQVGLGVAPQDPQLLAGLARVVAAEGDAQRAVELWDDVVAARPLPEHLAEYGTYLAALGRGDAAESQFAVLDAVQLLFEDGGVADDLTGAYLEADFGDPEQAVAHAERERALRTNVDSADAMAWALHSAGRDERALEFAREATSRGQDAEMLYHRGMIELALGRDDDARRHLRAALDVNPHFSPLHAPRAEDALAELVAP